MKDTRIQMNLRRWRRAQDLTQGEVSQATGIGQSTLSRYENGDDVPTLLEAEKLAKLYQCSVLDFLISAADGATITITITAPPAAPPPGAG